MTDVPRSPPAEPLPTALRAIGRLFFATSAAVGFACALLVALLPLPLAPLPQLLLAAALAVHALANTLAWRRSADERFPVRGGLFVLALAATALIGVASVLLGDGLRHPAFGFIGLMACLLAVVAGAHQGVTLAVAGVCTAAAVAWVQRDAGWHLLLPFHLTLIACAATAGLLLRRVLQRLLTDSAERERRFRGLLAIAADWSWEQDAEFRFTRVGDAQGRADHPDVRRLIGRTPWDAGLLGSDAELADAHRADLEAHRPFANLLLQRTDLKGRARFISFSGEPRFDADGVFIGYWGVGRDVTEQVRTQQAVAASESRYRALFERSPTALVLHRRGTVLDANEAAAQLFGYRDGAAMKGVHLLEHFAAPEQREQVRERMVQSERLGVGQALPVVDYTMRSVSGQSVAVQATAMRVATAGGPALLTIYVDITARKATEAALRRSEAMLSHLFATSPDVMALTDLDSGRFLLVNQRFTDIFGWSRAEAVGRSSLELGTWNDAADRVRFVERVRTHGSVEGEPLLFRRRDGSRVPMLVSAARVAFEGRRLMVLTARDVSVGERTRLEVEAILNTVSLAIAFVRGQRIVRINARHAEMFGFREEELRGAALSTLWPDESQFRAVRREALGALRQRQGYDVEVQLRRRDGSLFWCRLQARSVDPAHPIGGGTLWTAEDITERRQTQQALAAARDAAEAASRAKSAFLANTSHEIRTPLNGLLGLARLAMQPGQNEARRQQYLAQMVDSAQSLAGIISDILDLSKVEAGQVSLEDLPFALRETIASVHHAYRSLAEAKGLQLELSIDPALPAHVRGDPLRVRQILTNFVANALKFTERGRVRIEAGADGGRIRLAVHDSGPGIDPATQQRLFAPFTQADESITRRYGGTGLGLSICRELAQLMGGNVGVDSRPGRGSVFWAELPLPPVAEGSAPTPPAEAAQAPLPPARVLVAEDNPVNMLIVVAMLEQWGLRVAQAGDGAQAVEAVDAAAAAGAPFDLVLMDVHMPVMSGHAAVRRLRERFDAQTLPVVALTAAALVGERDDALASGMNDFLSKPIDPARLRETLARHLRRSGAAA
ncbi:PAS domain-containing hybrid sensor histidine kinase/response regulator [Piscinibacter defluvii]|uniref:PAS domain-containing hybrid sensor histidine kinase/response regulator n=1 Tax=Piscinibacter defluvii TaxID=1796922 RepID=UPI000FDD6462|nr:PAS domain S-box protein [Piscinibacter defluvii]